MSSKVTFPGDESEEPINANDPIFPVKDIPLDELTLHPAARLFPAMSDQQFQELVRDIERNGLSDPIMADTSLKVFDGRHRLNACRNLGFQSIPVRVVNWDEEKIMLFAVSANLQRRHLTSTQRATVAARIKFNEPDKKHTTPMLAERMNVGGRSIERAIKVIQEGSEGLQRAVERGEVTLGAAVEIAKLSTDEQDDLLGKGREEILERAAIIRNAPLSRIPDSQLTRAQLHNKYQKKLDALVGQCIGLPYFIVEKLVTRIQPCFPRIQILPKETTSDENCMEVVIPEKTE